MKKILLSITLFSCIYLSAQTVIVDEKFEKKNEPVDFTYLPISKKIVIMKGKTIPMGVAPFIYNAYSFDVNGKREVVVENDELMELTFSSTENSFKAFDLSKLRFNARYDSKYFNNNTISKVAFSDLNDIGDYYFGTSELNNHYYKVGRATFSKFSDSFNEFYEVGLTNQKGKDKINFEKDDLYLEVLDIKNSSKNRYKIEKPNLSLLTGKSYVEFHDDLSFNCRLNGNDNFDLISKSLSIDSRTAILYKNTFDFAGKKIKEAVYNLTLNGKFFICSDNGGGSTGWTGGLNHGPTYKTYNVLNVNNFVVDKKNGDVYIYGLFSNTAPQHKYKVLQMADGFYVFKFDKNGNKIWESINQFYYNNEPSQVQVSEDLYVNFVEYSDQFLFKITSNDIYEYCQAIVIEKAEGKVLKYINKAYDHKSFFVSDKLFVRALFVINDEFKNKSFFPNCFTAMSLNEKYLKYIKSLPTEGNRKYFNTFFSDQGIWLIETDNEEYYKVLLFKE